MTESFDLLAALGGPLASQGYRQLPIKKRASALFFKKVDDIFLTLGIEISARNKEAFTGSFYLAPTFSWSYAPPNEFPPNAYRRIGECLTVSQRRQVEPQATAKQVDIWWHGFTLANSQQFASLVKAGESRFLSTKDLVKSVKTCPAMRELVQQLVTVQQEYRQKSIPGSRLLEKVKKEDVVPAKWYLAAAKVAMEQFQDYNHKDGIKMLAEESWLLSEFGSPSHA